MEDLGFGCAFDEEGDFPALVDDGPGEGDAPGVFLRDVVGDDEVGEVVEALGVGEERGGVAVVAHAEEDEVEGRGFGAFELEGVANGGLVAGGGDLGVELAFHAEDVIGGERDFGEHGFAGHAVVGVGMVGGDAALVDPVEVELVPGTCLRKGCGVGEQREHRLRSGAAGDRDAGDAAGLTAALAASVKSCAAAALLRRGWRRCGR